MGPGTSFHRVLHEDGALCDDREVKRVVLCSGKVYYDLFEERARSAASRTSPSCASSSSIRSRPRR